MKTCLNCDCLTISRPKGLIWCKEDMLPSDDGKQRFIHLYKHEIKFYMIRDREIFHHAEHCILYPDFELRPGEPLKPIPKRG